ncbi:peptidoglycan-binding protein, partial [Methylobacterium sp. J-072]|nr:peptidoglycan-binding protein [Methylobacterium sp. J-072]
IAPQHLLAGAFGEFQPLDAGTTEETYAKNRRIEMKLTER